MSQYDFGAINPSTKSGTDLATDLNSWRDALLSSHSGPTRPTYVKAGQLWLNTASNPWRAYFFDGVADVEVFQINTSTHTSSINAGSVAGAVPSTTNTPYTLVQRGAASEIYARNTARAFIRFNSSTGAIINRFQISSASNLSSGRWRINTSIDISGTTPVATGGSRALIVDVENLTSTYCDIVIVDTGNDLGNYNSNINIVFLGGV